MFSRPPLSLLSLLPDGCGNLGFPVTFVEEGERATLLAADGNEDSGSLHCFFSIRIKA
jgi:hypothetical protein